MREAAARFRRALVVGGALAMLTACGATEPAAVTSTPATTASAAAASTTATPPPAPPAPKAPQSRNWFDLEVGDCVAKLPALELGDVSIPVVDCTSTHAAEVFLHAPLEVNTALADVANKQCTAAFARYTGHPVGGAYTVTYLIDSNQDRTSNNPYPSSVICLLQSATGQALTGTPRR